MNDDARNLNYSFERPIQVDDLLPLFSQTHWADERTPLDVERMLAASQVKIGAWRGDRLIGFARVLTDGLYRAVVDDVIVDASARKNGVATRMMHLLAERLADVEEIFLRCDAEMVPFYGRLGYRQRLACLDLMERTAGEDVS